MIVYPQERNKLQQILNENVNDDSSAPANFPQALADWYDNLVKSGTDAVWQNKLLSANKPALLTTLNQAFTSASQNQTASAYLTIEQAIQIGIVQYWTGAQLALTVPPPPSVQVVSNAVVNPGTASFSLPNPSESQDAFLNAVVQTVQTHLQTVSGITVSLTPQPTGPPIPISYPWQGFV